MLDDVLARSADHSSRHRLRAAIRHLLAMGAAHLGGVGISPLAVYEKRWPRDVMLPDIRRAYDPSHSRAAVPAGASSTWMAPFSAGDAVFVSDLVTAIRGRQVLGQLPGAVEVPPDTRSPFPTALPKAAWITVGGSIPVSRGAFDSLGKLVPYLLGSIVVATHELLRSTGPQAEATFRALLMNTAIQVVDDALLNPANAGVPDVSPPSLTHGAFSVASSGGTLADLNTDLIALTDHMAAAGIRLTSPVAIMSPASALRAGGLIAPSGGTFAIPVIQSPAAGSDVILLDGSYLVFTDRGIEIDISSQTSLEMTDDPTGDVVIPASPGGPVISLFGTDSLAFRLVQYVNWQLVSPDAVGVVTGFGAPTP